MKFLSLLSVLSVTMAQQTDSLYQVQPWSNEMWIALYATFIAHTLTFLVASYRKDNGILDI